MEETLTRIFTVAHAIGHALEHGQSVIYNVGVLTRRGAHLRIEDTAGWWAVIELTPYRTLRVFAALGLLPTGPVDWVALRQRASEGDCTIYVSAARLSLDGAWFCTDLHTLPTHHPLLRVLEHVWRVSHKQHLTPTEVTP